MRLPYDPNRADWPMTDDELVVVGRIARHLMMDPVIRWPRWFWTARWVARRARLLRAGQDMLDLAKFERGIPDGVTVDPDLDRGVWRRRTA